MISKFKDHARVVELCKRANVPNYVLDDKNEKVAVQIDLRKYGELWEDFYDSLLAEARKNEDRIPLEEVIRDLKSTGKLTEDV